ncbi:unnamed protein product [Cochlearia groenlandica]
MITSGSLLTAAEHVESRVSSETVNATEECVSGWDSFEEDVEGEHDRALIEDVEPRGYDTEFWEPFFESAYGGSNAAEVMLSDTEEKDEAPGLKFQRRDVSDFEFMFGNKAAEGNGKVKCMTGHDVPLCVDGRIPKNCSTPRSLESVDDEEFDLEPMFDDRQYVPSDIPDLDIDERDEEVYVELPSMSSLPLETKKHNNNFKRVNDDEDGRNERIVADYSADGRRYKNGGSVKEKQEIN